MRLVEDHPTPFESEESLLPRAIVGGEGTIAGDNDIVVGEFGLLTGAVVSKDLQRVV